jgi:uncharacterized protein YjiS (DUF1127 family)
MFASIARLLQAWTRASAVRRELSHLSDRELADIGITRSDIERIAANDVHDWSFGSSRRQSARAFARALSFNVRC